MTTRDEQRIAKLREIRDGAKAIREKLEPHLPDEPALSRESLQRSLRYLAAHVEQLAALDLPPDPPPRYGIWTHEHYDATFKRTVPASWLQGGGIPGPRYEQGEEAWMRDLLAKLKAENPVGWAKGNPEVRLLPPELAALRYEGGP